MLLLLLFLFLALTMIPHLETVHNHAFTLAVYPVLQPLYIQSI